MLKLASLALLTALAACGGDSGPTPIDASGASLPSVRSVTCPSGTVPTIMTDDTREAYTPSSTTINVGGIVKFTTSLMHDVSPNPNQMTDAGLVVGFNKTACLEFDKAGTFGFRCSSHGFLGTIIVR